MNNKNNRGQTSLTKTGIIFVIAVFYTVISVFVGFIVGDTSNIETATVPSSGGFFTFVGNIITGYAGLPVWLNAIIFTPLVLALTWIVLSSLPTLNGGG